MSICGHCKSANIIAIDKTFSSHAGLVGTIDVVLITCLNCHAILGAIPKAPQISGRSP
jgi:hypothetical protein